MLPEPGVFLALVLFGSWVTADTTSVGQFMVSRPIVSATVAGWIAGDPAAGALAGLILEALNLTVLPVGAARYPESGPAAVAAGAMLAHVSASGRTLLIAVLFALSWAWVAGVSVRVIRQLNGRLTSPQTLAAGGPAMLERRHLLAVGCDLLRGALLVAAGIPLLAGLLALTAAFWGLDDEIAHVALWAAVAAGIAASLRLFGDRRAALFVFGVLCGCLLFVLR